MENRTHLENVGAVSLQSVAAVERAKDAKAAAAEVQVKLSQH